MDDPAPPPAAGAAPLWYREGGLVVFTAAYHLRRGACCGNGCRHCPYDGREGTTEPVLATARTPKGVA